MKIRPVFAWYDLWFGAFWSRKDRTLYVMVPTVGIAIKFGRPAPEPDATAWPAGCGWPMATFEPGSGCIECGREIEPGTYAYVDADRFRGSPVCCFCGHQRAQVRLDVEACRADLRSRR